MCLVKYPATDLTLSYGSLDGAIAKLLGGDIEQGDIPHADLFENRTTFRQGEQSGYGRDTFDTCLEFKVVHLIFH